MNTSKTDNQSINVKTWSGVAIGGFFLSFITAFLFLFSGYGYQLEIWSLGTAFSVLRNSAYAAFGLILVNLLGIHLARPAGLKKGISLAITGLLLSIATLGTAVYWQTEARKYPAIHDITTDTNNPPLFDKVIPLRADAPNPPEYPGGETTTQQQDAYPHLQTVVFDVPPEQVFDMAVSLAEARKWELVSADREILKIEATDKLPWFGFKDDVVIRIHPSGQNGALLDMRSKSRIGRSDLGMNAYRIEKFIEDLQKKL